MPTTRKPPGDQQPTPPDGEQPPAKPGEGGADTMEYDYQGELSGALTADGEEVNSDGETISTDTVDQNAALAQNGGSLTITNGTLSKSGSDTNGDNCNFYGINSIILGVNKDSVVKVSNSKLTADSTGSNGILPPMAQPSTPTMIPSLLLPAIPVAWTPPMAVL